MTWEQFNVGDEVFSEEARLTQIQDRWEEGLGGGFVVLPTVLLRHQKDLDLDCEEVVVLANLLSHWWADGRMPFPRSESLAKRCGVSRRTVQRRLQDLEKKGFLRRVLLTRDDATRAIAHYDLQGTVERLKSWGAKAIQEREANKMRKGLPAGAGLPAQ